MFWKNKQINTFHTKSVLVTIFKQLSPLKKDVKITSKIY